MKEIGIPAPQAPSVFDMVGGLSEAISVYLRSMGQRTDIAEMAQIAAAEPLTAMGSVKSKRLFETTPENVKQAVRSFSTKTGLSALTHDFFSRLLYRYLTCYLDRELFNHVGSSGCAPGPSTNRASRRARRGTSRKGR